MHACQPKHLGMEVGESEVQGHPHLPSEFEASLVPEMLSQIEMSLLVVI